MLGGLFYFILFRGQFEPGLANVRAALAHGTINAVSGLPSLFLTIDRVNRMNAKGSLGYGFITVVPLMILETAIIAAAARKISNKFSCSPS